MTKEGRSFGRLRMTMEGRFFDSVPLRSRSLKRARQARRRRALALGGVRIGLFQKGGEGEERVERV
jgi:hypothetical protein